MNAILRSLLFISLVVFGFTMISAQTPSQTPAQTPASAEKKAIEVNLPEIEGWEKGAASGSVSSKMGYIMPYNSKNGGILTVYIYDRGLQDIPNDLKGVVKEEFDMTRESLFTLEKMGAYENVKEVKSETSALGGAKGKVSALYALFTLKMRGTDVKSEIFLFSYKGYFAKIRITQPKEGSEALNKEMANMYTALDAYFVK